MILLLLSSFWTSRGHRFRPFPTPVLAFLSTARRVRNFHCSSNFIGYYIADLLSRAIKENLEQKCAQYPLVKYAIRQSNSSAIASKDESTADPKSLVLLKYEVHYFNSQPLPLTWAATMRTTLCFALLLYPGALGLGVYLMNSASLRVWSPIDPGVAEVTFAPISCP